MCKEIDMNIDKKDKSRNIGVYGFFQVLQLEWIVSDLRCRLYPKQKDKDYWRKVREGKKETIDSIAEKNTLPSIFTDPAMKAEFDGKVFRKKSHPNFFYKDVNNENQQGFYDLLYYYAKGSDVRCEIADEIKVGKVKHFVPIEKHILVSFEDGSEKKLHIDDVTRIL